MNGDFVICFQVESDISDIYLQLHQGFEEESQFLVSWSVVVKVFPKLIHQWDWYSFIIIFFSAGWFGKVCFKSLPWTSNSSPRTWNIRIPCKLSKFFPLQWIAIRYVVFCMSKMLVCDVAGVQGSAETRQRIGALPTPRFCTLYKSRQMFSY